MAIHSVCVELHVTGNSAKYMTSFERNCILPDL